MKTCVLNGYYWWKDCECVEDETKKVDSLSKPTTSLQEENPRLNLVIKTMIELAKDFFSKVERSNGRKACQGSWYVSI